MPYNYGATLAAHEGQRRGLINLGLQQIGAVYGGGTAPVYSQATGAFDPVQTYYGLNSRGNFGPTWNGGSSYFPGSRSAGATGFSALLGRGLTSSTPIDLPGVLNNTSGSDVVRHMHRLGHLFTKGQTENFEGFQPSFYTDRARAYENYALPQLADQYRTNRDALNYGLTNRGLAGSTVADKAASDLERITGQNRQQIADTGIGQANQLRSDVEASRQAAIAQLYQSADPAQGFQSAVANASQFRAQPVFTPLADLFSNLARTYYINQTLNNYRNVGVGGGNSSYGLSGAVSGPTSR